MTDEQNEKLDISINYIDVKELLEIYLDRKDGFTIIGSNYRTEGLHELPTYFIKYKLDFIDKNYLLIICSGIEASCDIEIIDVDKFNIEFQEVSDEDLYVLVNCSKNLKKKKLFTLTEGYKITNYLLELGDSHMDA